MTGEDPYLQPSSMHRRSSRAQLPASGAWMPGDPPAWRRFAVVADGRPFALEGGGVLEEIVVAYETWGTLDATSSNAVLVCHALTGDAHAAGGTAPGQRSEGWWNDLIGAGKVIDTDRYFVVCVNVLGGCQGTTGPASLDPRTGRPYGGSFPMVSMRDIVRTQSVLADRLGVRRWHAVIGGSMGGMQALEWAVMFPHRVGALISIASTAAASALQIGWSQTGRLAVVNDARWNGGDYYDAPDGEGPTEGLMLARRIAQIHYRSDQSFEDRFARTPLDRLDSFALWDRFQIESYLDYHGEKLARRFDANSYLVLNKAMDLHDIGRGRGGIEAAAARVTAPTLVVSIDSDMLYTPRQQEQLRDVLVAGGTDVSFEVLHSVHGHDGFLIDFPALGSMMGRFLDEQAKVD